MLVTIPSSFIENLFNIDSDDLASLGYEDIEPPKSLNDISEEELIYTFGWTVQGFPINMDMDDYFDNVGYNHIPNDKFTYQEFLIGFMFPSIISEFYDVLNGKFEGLIKTNRNGLAIRINTNTSEE